MKSNIFIIIGLSATCLLTACHGDLDLAQKSEITSLSMWTQESDAASAVRGAYNQLRDAMSTSLPVYGDYRAGLYGGGMMSVVDYDKMAQNILSRDMEGTDWTSFYTTINSCNLVLKHLPEISFVQETDKQTLLANAYFIRAYCYFYIARVWGKAPVLTSGFESDKQADLYPSRQSEADVYAQVESDINQAVECMPSSVKDKYTASWGAVNMLKADYYLWKAKRLNGGEAALTEAKKAVDAVLSSSYTMEENFADIFGLENEQSEEIIFSFNYERNEYTGGYPAYYLAPVQYLEDPSIANNPVPIGSHQQYVSITDEYEDFLSANPADTRTATSFQVYQDGSTRWRWINKYLGEWTSETRYFTSDIIVYRLAEAVLFKAEIENALGNTTAAITELNKIAKRAYQTDIYYPSTLSKTVVDSAIVDEILKEFVAEGKSWWTLVRFGVAFDRIASLKGRENETNILLWPVSSNSINTNPAIEQTEGYN